MRRSNDDTPDDAVEVEREEGVGAYVPACADCGGCLRAKGNERDADDEGDEGARR